MENIGQRIKQLRKMLGLSQREFAEKIGKSLRAIQNWEYEQRTPDESTLRLISQTFGVNLEWLKSGEGEIWQERKTLERQLEDLPEEELEELLIAVKIIRKLEKLKGIKLNAEKRLKLAKVLIDALEEKEEINPKQIKEKADKLLEVYM